MNGFFSFADKSLSQAFISDSRVSAIDGTRLWQGNLEPVIVFQNVTSPELSRLKEAAANYGGELVGSNRYEPF